MVQKISVLNLFNKSLQQVGATFTGPLLPAGDGGGYLSADRRVWRGGERGGDVVHGEGV